MSFVPAAVDYAGRQVDIELLKSIRGPVALQRVDVDVGAGGTPRIVAGIQKAVQRYAHLLLTTLDDVKFRPELGGRLVSALQSGTVSNRGYMTHLFVIASSAALRAMNADDALESMGPAPDDERVESATLSSLDIDYSTGTVSFEVTISTRAGTSYTYVIPVSTGL